MTNTEAGKCQNKECNKKVRWVMEDKTDNTRTVVCCNDCAFDLFESGTHESIEDLQTEDSEGTEYPVEIDSVEHHNYKVCGCEDYPCCGH